MPGEIKAYLLVFALIAFVFIMNYDKFTHKEMKIIGPLRWILYIGTMVALVTSWIMFGTD